ncbi:MAG TPA: hypothetical protein VFO52_15315 [Longimicrobiales bacterium]|nr:hypothetical protein [Longimicrobiales bacterium]
MPPILQELQHRSVFQVAAVYAAVAFIVLQVADLTFPALALSETAYRVVVWVVLAGFPLALVLAWFFDIKPAAGKRASAGGDIPRRRFQFLSLVLIVLLLTGAAGVSAVRARLGEARAADGRIALAVFPFRALGDTGGEWSEGLADLLSTTLDGTEGMRVLDPWALWRELDASPAGPLLAPDPSAANALSRRMGGRRTVLGSVIRNGERVEITVRIYDPRFTRPLHTFALTGRREKMAELVEMLAVAVITRVWGGETMPGAARLEPNATHSPNALKAYLAAKAAMRRGWVDSAANAIDRAILLDSTFALALVDAVTIRSWHQFMTGRPYSGLVQLLERATAHADSLSPRSQLRLEAMRATVRTQGAAAADALRRILEIDSLDIGAWSSLAYVQSTYGWQYGADHHDALASTRRVVQLDSSYVPGLVMQAWLALATDSPDITGGIRRLARTDTTVTLARSTIWALQLLRAPPDTFDMVLQRTAAAPFVDWVAPLRLLRTYDPERASKLYDRLRARAAGLERTAILWTQVRQLVAEGRVRDAHEFVYAIQPPDSLLLGATTQLLAATALASITDSATAAGAVRQLDRNTQPAQAWWNLWLAAAYHAQVGDTATARRLRAGIQQLPDWGAEPSYRQALLADIDARLAARDGQLNAAIAHAQRAFELWGDHTENQPESMPDPAFRFHLAMLMKSAGNRRGAEPLLRSLVAPATWLGFYTARASFELGELAVQRGDTAAARRYYSAALRHWSRGGVEITAWRQQAERGLARVSPNRL